MNGKHILVVGRIDRDSSVIRVTCPAILEDCRELGALDARDGLECNPTRFLVNLAQMEAYIGAWHDETERLEAALAASDFVTPATMGELDAHDGVCDPTKHYAKLGDIEAYLVAWNQVVAAMADDVEFVADAYAHGRQDYADGLPCGVFRLYDNACDRQNYAYGYRAAKIDAAEAAARAEDAEMAEYEREPAIEDDHLWISHGC